MKNVTNTKAILPTELTGWLIDVWGDLQNILGFK